MEKEFEVLDWLRSTLEWFLNKTTDDHCQVTLTRDEAIKFVEEHKATEQIKGKFDENKKSDITGLSFIEFKKIHKNDTPATALDILHRLSLAPDYVKPNSVEERARRFLRDKVEQALTQLEHIKEENSDEALECFKEIKKHIEYDYEYGTLCYDFEEELSTIKRTLLKAQVLEEENGILLGQNKDYYDELMLADKQHKEFAEFAMQQSKVLKIIFEKNVNMEEIFESEDVVEYNKGLLPVLRSSNALTDDEFNTLKKAHHTLEP